MKRVTVVTFVILALIVPTFAISAGNYASFKIGPFFPNDDSDGLEDFDTGYNLEAALGHMFNQNFSIEAGLGYYKTELDEVSVDATVSAVPVTATAKGILPLTPTGNIYAGAGLGVYFANADVDVRGVGSADDDDQAIGLHLVGGGEIFINDKVALGAELKWFTAEPEFNFSGMKEDVKIGGVDLNIGIRFLL